MHYDGISTKKLILCFTNLNLKMCLIAMLVLINMATMYTNIFCNKNKEVKIVRKENKTVSVSHKYLPPKTTALDASTRLKAKGTIEKTNKRETHLHAPVTWARVPSPLARASTYWHHSVREIS